MIERPILFSAPMVKAILAGTKTQTRRVVKPQPEMLKPLGPNGTPWPYRVGRPIADMPSARFHEPFRCPYGAPGDHLWVREHYFVAEVTGCGSGYPFVVFDDEWTQDGGAKEPCPTKLRPITGQKWGSHAGFHLPRAASRITLAVESVRIERVQDITLDDARAEGIPQTAGEAQALGLHDLTKSPGHEWDNRTSAENYARLWDSINAARGFGWDANPWVWAITFRVLESKSAAG